MILRRAFMFLNVDILYSLLSVVNSVITVRILGANLFGQLTYLLAVLALTPSFYSVFDNTLVRFAGGLAPRRQRRLFVFVICCKTMALVLSSLGIAVWYLMGRDKRLVEVIADPYMATFALAVCLTLPMELFSRSLESVMQSLEMYGRTMYLRVSQAASMLMLNLVLWLTASHGREVLLWRAGHYFISGISLLIYACWALREAGWWRKIRRVGRTDMAKDFIFSYRMYFKPYSQPLSVGLLFEYAKSNLPSLLLAHATTYENVAYYRVFKNLFEISKKTLPKIANTLLPTIVRMKESDARFESGYLRFSRLYMTLIGVVALGTFLFHPLILRIYHLQVNQEASWTSLLFSLCLITGTFGFILNFRMLLEKDTIPQYYISTVGGVSYIALLVLLTPFGMIGATLALLCKGLVTSVQFQYYVVHKHRYMSVSNYWKLAGLNAGFCLLLGGALLFIPR
jgi:O-antigen/teichoic acid export membrane protein